MFGGETSTLLTINQINMENTFENARNFIKSHLYRHLAGGEARQQEIARCMVEYSKMLMEADVSKSKRSIYCSQSALNLGVSMIGALIFLVIIVVLILI